MKLFYKSILVILCVCIIFTNYVNIPLAIELVKDNTEATPASYLESSDIISDGYLNSISYSQYLINYKDSVLAKNIVEIDVLNFSSSDNCASIDLSDKGKYAETVTTKSEGSIEWEVFIENEGLYNINIDYYTDEGKGSAISRAVFIDGKMPFTQSGNIVLSRAFQDITKPQKDKNGNEMRPQQKEKNMWLTSSFMDATGYYPEPLMFYLTPGIHKIKFISIKENLTIGKITLGDYTTLMNYSQVKETYNSLGYVNTSNQSIKIEAEETGYKSDNMIVPIADSSSSAISPSNPTNLVLNTVGGVKWQNPGQWVVWDFQVVESGLYKIAMKAKQDLQIGQSSFRKIYIDNKIPFEEFKSVEFEYGTDYKMLTLGGENPYLVYLEKGNHTIKMENTLSEYSEIVQQVSESIFVLNEIYRKFLMVLGKNPDMVRDYMLYELMPEEFEKLAQECKKLEKARDEFYNISKLSGSQLQTINNIINLAKKMIEKPKNVPKLFNDYYNNISGLGTWLNTVIKQPIQIDYIMISSQDVKFPSIYASIIDEISFNFKKFISSFFANYNNIGNSQYTRVWISSGRDQASALNQLAKNNFTTKSNIEVDIQLVPAGTLLMALVAGNGPDVALFNGQSDPLNYAVRGAVYDLNKFSDTEEVIKRFQPSAYKPFQFNGALYAIPETQSFPMMFYRKDILKMLGLQVPKTWDEVISMLPILQQNNLIFGMPQPQSASSVGVGLSPYAMLLYQNGGSLYDSNNLVCQLDNKVAISTFTKWASFYTEYGLPLEYDFANRFRSGEMPIGIADYGTYNLLSVFAPELEGLWGLLPVPGTLKPDGSIDISVAGTSTGTCIMQSAKNKNNAWEFVKWWTDAPAQTAFANELESILGTSGRYQTANIEALYNIPWSSSDFKSLMKQWQYTKEIPETPGSYMTSRYLDFAFKKFVIEKSSLETMLDPGQIMIDMTKLINKEMVDKQKEFGFVKK